MHRLKNKILRKVIQGLALHELHSVESLLYKTQQTEEREITIIYRNGELAGRKEPLGPSALPIMLYLDVAFYSFRGVLGFGANWSRFFILKYSYNTHMFFPCICKVFICVNSMEFATKQRLIFGPQADFLCNRVSFLYVFLCVDIYIHGTSASCVANYVINSTVHVLV